MPPPSSLLARLKATTTECSSVDDSASTYLSRPSSLSRAAAINTNNNASAMNSRPQMAISKAAISRSSSLAKAAAATGPITSTPTSLGQRVGYYIHNIGDGEFDSVEDDRMAYTATTQKNQSTVRAPSENGASSTAIADLSEKIESMAIVRTKLTTLEQLLGRQQQVWDAYSIPPYHMCLQSEACDRAQHLELSPFEYSHEQLISFHLQQRQYQKQEVDLLQRRCSRDNRPTFDPHRVVKKYRRSAAGGGTLSGHTMSDDDRYRSMDMLKTTVDYLLKYVFVHQRPPPPPSTMTDNNNATNVVVDPNEISIWGEDDDENDSNDDTLLQQHQKQVKDDGPLFSLAETVSFIDDRIRAVQKDLVTLLGNLPAQQHLHQQQQLVFETKRSAREMQASIVRYNILASYLLSNLPLEKYEKTFGARALRTAMASYRELSRELYEDYHPLEISDEKNSIEQRRWRLRRQRQQKELSMSYKFELCTRDEIMAYTAILHSSAVMYSEERALYTLSPEDGARSGVGAEMSSLMEDGGSGWGALLLMMSSSLPRQKRCHCEDDFFVDENETEKYPCWKWAVNLASAAQNGNYQRYFALLESGPAALDAATTADEDGFESQPDHARFLILARCCASHSLNLVRLGQLRRYNQAFRKGEAVSAADMARLLRFGTGVLMTNDGEGGIVTYDARKWAADFCRDAGLPVVEKEGGERGISNMCILMKAAPICVKGDAMGRMFNPGRMNDIFVFGSRFDRFGREYYEKGRVNSSPNPSVELIQQQSVDIKKDDVDNWEDCDDRSDDYDNAKKTGGASVARSTYPCDVRYDEDGVLIPTWRVLKSLIE